MNLSDFDYDLPPSLIAQHPPPKRGESRLLILDRQRGRLEHRLFPHFPQYLRPGDILVVNDTKVLPARLAGKKESGGQVEILLVRKKEIGAGGLDSQEWECLAKSSGKIRERTRVLFPGGIQGELVGKTPEGLWRLFLSNGKKEDLDVSLKRVGCAPLPPYIRRSGNGATRARDLERYQTVYARREGAIAAPTAGLHFTVELLEEIRGKGVKVASLTLHVGIGTFLPVKIEEVEKHRLEPEYFEIPPETADRINEAHASGRRVIAVGTTVTRALEASADGGGRVQAQKGKTGLFILPGYRFRVVDGLVTNFHLPRSTLLMLVSAFAGRELILAAYQEAMKDHYRFYSYGDAMLIL